jgi:hypothetical protein
VAQLPPSSSSTPAYSQLPSPNDPSLVEAAAQQITTSSLNNYGALPNPEAAYESLITQSVPSLVGAIQSQDPEYQSVLSSLPAGSNQAAQVPAAVPSNLVTPPATYNFNAQQFKQETPLALSQPANSSWKSFGEVPALNMGYANQVMNLQDPNRIKQWQTLLKKQQFYTGPTNGVMDTNTKSAFESMLASQAMPVMLYSQNQQQQAAAATLLSALGYDNATLQTDAYHDPVIQHQIVTQWMQAQGPDQSFGDKSELDNYVSQFGAQNLPAAWQSVYSQSTNPLEYIAQGIGNLPILGSAMSWAMPGTAFVKKAISPTAQSLTAQLKAAEASQAKAENLNPQQLKTLTEGDQAALAGVVNQVSSGSGFMGFMDVYDRGRTNALLSTHFVLADGDMSGNPLTELGTIVGNVLAPFNPITSGSLSSDQLNALKGTTAAQRANLNPFDPKGLVGQQVAAADGSAAAGLFGNDWATKHATLATIYNASMNMVDDPLSYVPVVGVWPGLPEGLSSGTRALGKMSEGLGVFSKIGITMQRLANVPEVADLMTTIKDSPYYAGVVTDHDILGGVRMGSAFGDKQLAAIKALRADPNATADDWTSLFTEYKFDHRIANMSGVVERKIFLSHLGRVFDMNRTGFRAILAKIGQTNHLGDFTFNGNLGGALQDMQDWAAMAQMDPKEYGPLLDAFVGVPEEDKLAAFQEYKTQLVAAIDKIAQKQGRSAEDVFNAITKRRRSVFGAMRAGSNDVVSGFMADPKLGQEMSWTDLHDPDPVVAAVNQQIKNIQDLVHMQGGMIDNHADLMAQTGMESANEGQSVTDAATQDIEQMLKPKLDDLIDQRDAYKKLPPKGRRPSPAISEQLRDNYSMPFSMSELMTELNPALKGWDKAQHAVGMDVLTQLWKPWILANMGTALRVTLGEDLIRPAWEIWFRGHPLIAAKLIGTGIGKAIAAGTIPDKVAIPLSRLFREDTIVDEASNLAPEGTKMVGGKAVDPDGNELPGYAAKPAENLHPGREIRSSTQKNLNTMGAAELGHSIMSKYMSVMDPEVYVQYSAGTINYDQALAATINKWSNSTMIRPYLDELQKQGGAFADEIPEATYYHGTSTRWPADEMRSRYEMGTGRNMFGPGTYVTDSSDVAASYTAKGLARAKALGSPSKTVYGLEPTKELNMVDLSKPLAQEHHAAFLQAFKDANGGELGDAELQKLASKLKSTPGDQIYAELRQDLEDNEVTMSEADEILQGLHDALEDKGVDGFKYEGGKYTQSPTKHQASVVFDHSNLKVASATDRSTSLTEAAAIKVLKDTIDKSTEPGVAEIRRLHPNTDAHAALLHEFLKAHMEIPELRQMWLDGAADPAALRPLIKAHAYDGTSPMPVIFAPRNTLAAQHFIMKAINKYPQWMFDKEMSPMITAARSEGALAMRKMYIGDLKEFYKDPGSPTGLRADWTDRDIEDEADGMAYQWMKRNVYMGQRTMMGAQLRNVFPFWGATANMARFYLREGLSHPFSADATLRLASWSQQQQANNQQYATGANGFLSMLGFTGGDALSIDPFHSFFLTSDGVDSFVPGTGPWVNLMTSFVPGHQAVAEALANTPLASEGGLDSTTGQAAPIIPWLGQLATGVADTATAAMGNTAPVNLGPLGESVDAQTEQEDELIRQREEQGQSVDPNAPGNANLEQNLLSEVGRKFMLEGALRWATPVTPSIVNQPGQALTNAMTAYNAATTTQEKDNLIAAELGTTAAKYQAAIANQTVPQLLEGAGKDSPAVAMAYFDSNVTPEQRDIIGAQHPWVTAYEQSFYDRPTDPETGKPAQSPESSFDTEVNTGNISLENATNYINKIQNAMQVQQGWLAVDQLNNAKYAFLRDNGITTQSTLYKQWDAEVYQPALTSIDSSNQAWSAAFGSGSGSGTSLSEEAERTAPLRTLMSLEVIPQDPAFETTSTTLWRQALVWRDQAANQIAAMQMGTHSTAEIELVMEGLQSRLAWLGQQDPTFAQQLDGYTFGKWEDVVTMESDEIRNQELYGVAT